MNLPVDLLAESSISIAKEQSMPVASASDLATVVPAGTWSIDPVWSSVEFTVRKLSLVRITGRAGSVSGTITGGASPSIVGTVDAAGITTFDEQRDAHVASPDFFDV